MPQIVTSSPAVIGNFAINNTFDGVVVLRIGQGWDATRNYGIGSARNVVISVEGGLITQAHQCDRAQVLNELPLPLSFQPSAEGLDYHVGWASGKPRALRANMIPHQLVQRLPVTNVVLPDTPSVELASLLTYKAPEPVDTAGPTMTIISGEPV